MIENLVRTGKARFEFGHYLGHSGSDFAAEAMECAADQSGNAFWQFHDEYMTSSALRALSTSRDRAIDYARQIGLDVDRFQQCLDNRTHRDRINREFSAARNDGVSRSPTILVNGTNAGTSIVSITQRVEQASE